MFEMLFHLSDIWLFVALSIFCITISLTAAVIISKLIPHELRYKDNPVLGNIGALISIIYGVLAGLTALYLLNINDYAANAVQNEANAAADIYRSSRWLNEPASSYFRNQIKTYLTTTITTEWPLMQYSHDTGEQGNMIIEQMDKQLRSYKITPGSDDLLNRNNIIADIKLLYDARQQRIQFSNFSLSPEVWLVLIIGTILTVVVNYLFAMNLYLHMISLSFVALMASSMLFLLISLDRPFTGEFGVDASPLQSVLNFIEQTSKDKH